MFKAHLHPRRSLADLTPRQCRDLYEAIKDIVCEVIRKRGRNDETDLFGKPGGYIRLMDSHATGKPYPECGRMVEKILYLGGACYFCPKCQG
jgi:formamidopyrimidine-DNA glycosylase